MVHNATKNAFSANDNADLPQQMMNCMSMPKQNLLFLTRWNLALSNANKRITSHCNATPGDIFHTDIKLLKLLFRIQTSDWKSVITHLCNSVHQSYKGAEN